ncbi:MAG TPA: 3-isopropylmalate dehydratase small subunit [Vicinamibacterales bacterium]|nr:3-isopropylmalate dehydratase small subunit [Vicinamibacterales bacterium]
MIEAAHRITSVEGTALPLRGDDIDTDRIIPARYLRAITFEGMERHVFEDDRKASAHPFDDPRFAGARILLVNGNFGCGSSREHAPQAIYRWGIRAIVGESFSDIFFGNSVAIGLPCVTATRADLDALMALVDRRPRTTVRVDLARLILESDTMTFEVRLPLPTQQAFVSGTWDTTGMMLERFGEVRAAAERLPYIKGFSAAPRL